MRNSFKMYFTEENKNSAERIKRLLEKKGLQGVGKELSQENRERELLADLKADENETTWFITIDDKISMDGVNESNLPDAIKVTDGGLGLSYRTTAEAFAIKASMGPNCFNFH